MKKIIPFKKDIIFKTHIAEVTSISLEHSLHIEDNELITGEFIVSGEYKISDNSTNTEVFNFNLPFDIHMDDRYDITDCNVDIYDFYYEIINENILSVNIEVNINNFKEKIVLKEQKKDITDILKEEEMVRESKRKVDELMDAIDEVKSEEARDSFNSETNEEINVTDKINTLFANLNSGETYATYKIYIVRETDNLEIIMDKYKVSKEILEQYNDLTELKIGDKLIIPNYNDAPSK